MDVALLLRLYCATGLWVERFKGVGGVRCIEVSIRLELGLSLRLQPLQARHRINLKKRAFDLKRGMGLERMWWG